MRSIVSLVLLTISITGYAQSLNSINLQYRSAEHIIPLVSPLLQPGEIVTGNQSQLLISSSLERQKEIKKLVKLLDIPIKQLLIEIKSPATFSKRQLKKSEKVKVSPKPHPTQTKRVFSTQPNLTIQQIKVLDNHTAHVRDGQIVPLLRYAFNFNNNDSDGGIGFEHVEAVSEVSLHPTLIGDTVNLEVSPHYSQRNQEHYNVLEIQSASTTINMPLGQWTSLNSEKKKNNQNKKSIISTRQDSDETFVRISIIE